jgi:hypothetical protein
MIGGVWRVLPLRHACPMFAQAMRGMAVLALAAVTLGGCGSGQQQSAKLSAAAAAARARYIAGADPLCRRGIVAIGPVNTRAAEIERLGLSAPLEAEGLIPVVKEGARQYRAFVRRLKSTPAPAGDSGALNAIFAAHEKVAADLDRLAEVLEGEEFSAVKTVTAKREADHARAIALERAYGFKVCGLE